MAEHDGQPLCHRCGHGIVLNLSAYTQSPNVSRRALALSSGDATDVRRQVEMMESDLNSVDATVRGLENALAFSLQKRSELEMSLRDHANLLTPISRLPPELLSQIFQLATHFHGHAQGRRRAIAKLALGWVCSQWREISIGASELWTTWELGRRRLSLRLLRNVWVPRSGSAPLTIDFASGGATDRHTSEFMQTVLSVSPRWQVVSLLLASGEGKFLPSRPLRLPLLRSLSLDAGVRRVTARLPVMRTFSNAPLLRNLLVHELPFSSLGIAGTQLDTLCYDFANNPSGPKDCMQYLKECPQLRFFTSRVVLRENSRFLLDDVTHTTLNYWHLHICDAKAHTDVCSMFSAVTLPNLSQLSVHCGEYSFAWSNVPFVSFLARSRCPIRTLSLRFVHMFGTDLLQALAYLPAIEHLSLDNSAQNDNAILLEGITYPDSRTLDRECLLPNLQSLLLKYDLALEYEYVFPEETAIAMVWSRLLELDGLSRLRRLVLGKELRTAALQLKVGLGRAAGLEVDFI